MLPECGVKIVDGNKTKDGGNNYTKKYGHTSELDYKDLVVSHF